LTTVLLYVAGLSVHSLVRVLSFDYGFDDGNVLVADLPLIRLQKALLCVPLAILGVSSGLLFAVNAQSREIGIKLALGASPSQARRNVIQTALRLTSIGGAIGVVVGIGIGTLMDNQLFEVSPIDPVIVVVVSGGMLAICWCSAFVPGTRASQIDPVVVLKNTSF
jgi:putative ABC transport system permease protein